jgi:hypothetical protein
MKRLTYTPPPLREGKRKSWFVRLFASLTNLAKLTTSERGDWWQPGRVSMGGGRRNLVPGFLDIENLITNLTLLGTPSHSRVRPRWVVQKTTV